MTLTLPTYVSSRYAGTVDDFKRVKADRSGALRSEPFTTSILTAAASDTLIGLVPFQKGARFVARASNIAVTDLDSDSDLTLNFGYTYYNSDLGTSDPDAFGTAITTGQTGGAITLDELNSTTLTSWIAAADGWITMQIGTGGVAYTTGVVFGEIVLCYDTAG